MIFNNEETRLKKGDMVVYSEKTGIVMFFRNNQPLLFSNNSAQAFLYLKDMKFLVFIKILAETNGLVGLGSLSIQEIQTYPIAIKKQEYLRYIF